MICPDCGNSLNDDDGFCGNCDKYQDEHSRSIRAGDKRIIAERESD